jgi:hypothetical protein
MYLLFPVLVKVSLGMDGLRLSPYAGACYVLPLGTDIGGVTYRVKAGLPLGVMAGFEIGGAPGGGKRGELYGSLRYGIDLGLFSAEGARLQYTRSRLVFSLGYRFGIGKRGEGNSE